MDESLLAAAKRGDLKNFYTLIQRNRNVLRHIDELEFVDTPLHIAVDAECIDFAMEILILKPSLARKLNQEGLTPLHIAVNKGYEEMVLRFVEFDKDLVRVKGKMGMTPLHYISEKRNLKGVLKRVLDACPECIQDVTTKKQTALHIAVEANNHDVLEVLVQTLRKTDYCKEVLNQKDKDGNTALHVAADKNKKEILKLLLNHKADRHAINQVGKTALQVAREHDHKESISILLGCCIPRLTTFKYKLKRKIQEYVTNASSVIFHDLDNISSDDRNALLVILGLLLTATFQASLSPPRGVYEGQRPSNSTDSPPPSPPPESEKRLYRKGAGVSLLHETDFLLFYVPTSVVFIVTFFLTLVLLKPYPRGFRTVLQILLAVLAICFNESIIFLAPNDKAANLISVCSLLVFLLMMLMSLANRVSTTSVLILGCWLFPTATVFADSYDVLGFVFIGCLFLFLHDGFIKGTGFLGEFCLAFFLSTPEKKESQELFLVALVGVWFLLWFGRLCITICNKGGKFCFFS